MSGEQTDILNGALARIREEIKGNGLRESEVTLKQGEISTLEFPAILTLDIKTATTTKKQPGKAPGQHVQDAAALQNAIRQEEKNATDTPETLQRIRRAVLETPDAGPGMKDASIPLPFLRREYVYYETCAPCAGRGRTTCNRCHGKGQERCPRCQGAGYETCTACNGQRHIYDGQGNRQCLRCNATGKTPCTQCQQTRTIQCPACKGQGNAICPQCRGQMVNSVITMVEKSAQMHFDFERTGLSSAVIKAIEEAGTSLTRHAENLPAPPKIENGKEEPHIRYHVRLPVADAVFSLGETEIPALVFGLQGELRGLPPFLETLLRPAIADLEAAARKGGAEDGIKRAGQIRTLRYALQAAARWDRKKAARALMQKFPLGLSSAGANALAGLAETALRSLSRKSALACRVFPVLAMLGVYGLYAYSARPVLLDLLPKPELDLAADMVIPLGLAFMAFSLGRSCARQSREKDLRRLLSSEKKNRN